MHENWTRDASPAEPDEVRNHGGRTWPILVLLCTAQFMLVLDITVVNVALPSIQTEVGMGMSGLHWVITAYTLAFGGLIILGGRAGDIFGRRRVFLTGLALFTLASLVAALATNPAALIAARASQGVGAALLSPAALALISTVFPDGAARNRALAAWAAVAASGGAAGVLIGGALTEAFGWRAIFTINVPVGLVLAVGALRAVPSVRPARAGRLDPVGAILATGSLVALIYSLAQAESAGWTSARTLGLFGLAGVGFAAFVISQRLIRDPLVRLSIFRRRQTVAALILMILGMGPVFSGFYFSSLYLQQVLGHSALRTGLEFLPIAVAIVVAAHVAGRVISRVGVRPVIATGLATAAGGTFHLSGMSPDGSYTVDVLQGFLLLGIGGGMAAAGVMVAAMSGAGPEDSGQISGLANTAHELSIAITLPILSTVAAANTGPVVMESNDPGSALTGGIASAFEMATVLALIGVAVALTLLRRTDVIADPQRLHAFH